MERMAEADRAYRRDQQQLFMDALAMLGNIRKDVSKGKECKHEHSLLAIYRFYHLFELAP